jgi:hypothetical protein
VETAPPTVFVPVADPSVMVGAGAVSSGSLQALNTRVRDSNPNRLRRLLNLTRKELLFDLLFGFSIKYFRLFDATK